MDKNNSIAVLLATYNGDKFLGQQLDSIFNQDFEQVHLIARDDGSFDKTLSILKQYKTIHSNRLSIINNNLGKSGHCANFSALCEIALTKKDNYFCFSDQDDVWQLHKLSTLKSKMDELEKIHGKDTPILIHSDLRVVDEKLIEVAPSFITFQGLPEPDSHDFPKFLYQNVVTGCTTMFNRALLEIAGPIPPEAIVHDWWFAQCAKLFGVLAYVGEPLIDYRQHGKNAIGANSYQEQTSYFKKHIYKSMIYFPKHLAKSIKQTQALSDIIHSTQVSVCHKNKKMIDEFSNFNHLPAEQRKKWANIAITNPNSFIEKCYFTFAFFVSKWIKP